MNSRPSEIIERLTGYDVVPVATPTPATLQALTVSCRTGELRLALEQFIDAQRETLFVETLVVEKVDANNVTGRILGKTEDHESNSPYSVEVQFDLNLNAKKFTRLS